MDIKNYEKIIFEAENGSNYVRKFSFKGIWLYEAGEADSQCQKHSIALTAKNKLLVLSYGGREKPIYEVFDTFEDLVDEDFISTEILTLVAGKFIEELDI